MIPTLFFVLLKNSLDNFDDFGTYNNRLLTHVDKHKNSYCSSQEATKATHFHTSYISSSQVALKLFYVLVFFASP